MLLNHHQDHEDTLENCSDVVQPVKKYLRIAAFVSQDCYKCSEPSQPHLTLPLNTLPITCKLLFSILLVKYIPFSSALSNVLGECIEIKVQQTDASGECGGLQLSWAGKECFNITPMSSFTAHTSGGEAAAMSLVVKDCIMGKHLCAHTHTHKT